MNYADEATRMWDLAVQEEMKVNWIKDDLRPLAERNVDSKTRQITPTTVQRNLLIDLELRRLCEESIARNDAIGMNQFLREKAQTLALLALVHGHEPSREQVP